MIAWTFLPSSVPRALWSRNMSPVEMCGMRSSDASIFACVPLPAPGGPRRMRITSCLQRGAGPRSRVHGLADAAAADARAARAGEALVVARDEVTLDLL